MRLTRRLLLQSLLVAPVLAVLPWLRRPESVVPETIEVYASEWGFVALDHPRAAKLMQDGHSRGRKLTQEEIDLCASIVAHRPDIPS